MPCKKCEIEPVHELTSGIKLCKSCFIKYFEKKVRKTIKKFDLIENKDKVCVAISGGKDSLTVLHTISKLQEKRDIEVFALLVDEGIKNYREFTIKDAKAFCEPRKIPLHIISYKEEFGYPLDKLIEILGMKPCTICGVFRRYLLNKKARELGATKLATGHNLDDEAQSILMNQLKKNIQVSARMGPITGTKEDNRFIKRVKPLYLMTEKEVGTYAFLKKFLGKFTSCTYEHQSFRSDVRDLLNNLEAKHHGTKYNIITSFLEILPLLKEKYTTDTPINACIVCKEPTSSETCKACEILKKLKEKN